MRGWILILNMNNPCPLLTLSCRSDTSPAWSMQVAGLGLYCNRLRDGDGGHVAAISFVVADVPGTAHGWVMLDSAAMVGNIRKWCNLWGSNWGLMDVDGNLMYSVIWWWLRREHHEDHELDAVVMFAAQILICTFPPGNKICINCVYVCQLVLISPWPHSKEGWADMTNDSSRWLVSVVWCVCVYVIYKCLEV